MKKITLLIFSIILLSGCSYEIVKTENIEKKQNQNEANLLQTTVERQEEELKTLQQNIENLQKTIDVKKEVTEQKIDKKEPIKETIATKPLEKIQETDKETSIDEEFEKKLDCSKFREDIVTKFKNDTQRDVHFYLEEMFYSPVENSCIAFYSAFFSDVDVTWYFISDQLTNKIHMETETSIEKAMRYVDSLK